MSRCDALVSGASDGVAAALTAVDCMTAEATAGAFARLFGPQGALLPVLTALLTLYIAIFALGLLTGRTRLGVAALTPRMLLIGVVLTFATSWVAYQGVLWNLAVGGPDQVAGVLMGSKGSASQAFVQRIDLLFQAIADAAEAASEQAAVAAVAKATAMGNTGAVAPTAAQAAGAFAPASLVWLAAVMLLLGTVGLMVTARIVLAVLLALGPVFIVLGLIKGTRGLCAGWLRALAMVAIVPLLAVIGGALTIELAVPVVQRLAGPEGVEARPAFALFLIASVHCALMALALKTGAMMVSGWKIFGLSPGPADRQTLPQSAPAPAAPAFARIDYRPGGQSAFVTPAPAGASPLHAETPTGQGRRAAITPVSMGAMPGMAAPLLRAHGVGSRWRRPATRSEIIR